MPSLDHVVASSFRLYQQKLTDVFDEVFLNLKNSLNGRQACIPVSADWTRLVLTGLLKHGHQNILAYSYGLKKNSDAEAAEAVCKQLQVAWVFIEMTPTVIRKFSKSTVYLDYCKFAFTGDSIPFIQDLYAVDFLLNTLKLVEDDSIFITETLVTLYLVGTYQLLFRVNDMSSGMSKTYLMLEEYTKTFCTVGSIGG